MNPYVIERQHVAKVCSIGTGADTCRYLVAGGDGFECAKHQDGFRQEIDRRVASGSFVARGDNCEGLKGADDV